MQKARLALSAARQKPEEQSVRKTQTNGHSIFWVVQPASQRSYSCLPGLSIWPTMKSVLCIRCTISMLCCVDCFAGSSAG
jgi:hypothetical protein